MTNDNPRVIVHLDLDAFYAAVEHVRKNIPKNEPLGVQQWNHLIAVNYAAREFGIKRCHVDEARKLCPQIHCVHVDTIGEGKFKKAQLGPYRRASVRILEIIKRYTLKFERASIDEVFMDLTDVVQANIISNPNLDLTDIGTIYGEDSLDRTNIHLAYAAAIVKKIRYDIEHELGYTASAGIASTKVVAKLCSAFNKPNKQTIVPDNQILNFMKLMPIRKIRMLGGVLGEELSKHTTAVICHELWEESLENIQNWMGVAQGQMIYNLIRGVDNSEITIRHIIKSHMVAKSEKFLTQKDLEGVVLVLSFELHERLFEDFEENNRWPKTITISGSWLKPTQKSKSIKFAPFSEKLTAEDLYNITMNLLSSLKAVNGHVIPCYRLSIQLSNLEVLGKNSISNYFNFKPLPNSAGGNIPDNDSQRINERGGAINNLMPLKRRKSPKKIQKPKRNVFEMLSKSNVETFYCPSCKQSFTLDLISIHSEHNKD